MSYNPTRMELDPEGHLSLIAGDDELGDSIRLMSEEELSKAIVEMVALMRRSEFRIVPSLLEE